MMDIRPQPQKPEFDASFNTKHGVANEMAVLLDINKKKVQVRKSKIKDVARGLAEIAFDIGETNDPEEFAEEMTENIYEAFKKVNKNQKDKKNKK